MFGRKCILGLSVLFLCVTFASAAIVAPPAGVTDYHYLFVTEGTTQATNVSYSYYDNFADTQANPLSSLTTSWYPIVSTYDGHGAKTGLPTDLYPVYNTHGQLLASSISALFSGSGLSALPKFDQYGEATLSTKVWTGSDRYGDPVASRLLGVTTSGGLSFVGNPNASSWYWLADYGATPNQGQTNYSPIYVLSGAITTVPEPATLIIWSLLGGLSIAVGLWRRRKAA